MITFESALDVVSQLSIDQQEMLIHIIRKRNTELRRKQILKECHDGLVEYRSGVLKPMTAEEAIANLHLDIGDRSDEKNASLDY